MCGLVARVMECAARGRPYSGCEPSFAGAGMAGREVRVGCDAGSTGQPGAIRPVKQALLWCSPQEAGARDTCARPGCCGRGPPDALEPFAGAGDEALPLTRSQERRWTKAGGRD